MRKMNGWMLACVLAAGCGDDPRPVQEDDALDTDSGLSDGGQATASDASVAADAAANSCSGSDPFAQLFCQLFGGGGNTAQPAAGQPDLAELLGILTDLGGQLGGAPRGDAGSAQSPFGRGGSRMPVDMPTERDCMNPADRITELLCRMTADAAVRGPRGTQDAGRPAADAGAPVDSAAPDSAAADSAAPADSAAGGDSAADAAIPSEAAVDAATPAAS